jgi:hypothetical protein
MLTFVLFLDIYLFQRYAMLQYKKRSRILYIVLRFTGQHYVDNTDGGNTYCCDNLVNMTEGNRFLIKQFAHIDTHSSKGR